MPPFLAELRCGGEVVTIHESGAFAEAVLWSRLMKLKFPSVITMNNFVVLVDFVLKIPVGKFRGRGGLCVETRGRITRDRIGRRLVVERTKAISP